MLDSLPTEIVASIFEEVSLHEKQTPAIDIHSLTLVNKRLSAVATPFVYRTLKPYNLFTPALASSLSCNPDLSRHVRSLHFILCQEQDIGHSMASYHFSNLSNGATQSTTCE